MDTGKSRGHRQEPGFGLRAQEEELEDSGSSRQGTERTGVRQQQACPAG